MRRTKVKVKPAHESRNESASSRRRSVGDDTGGRRPATGAAAQQAKAYLAGHWPPSALV